MVQRGEQAGYSPKERTKYRLLEYVAGSEQWLPKDAE